jgi:poly(hydroxyalkanoate) depolymerase family esterase
MRNISDTIARMAAMKARATVPHAEMGGDRLALLPPFGANPGALVGRTYIPEHLSDGAPLVVVLHGCTQTAAAYDRGSGWSELADREGFAVLYAEQQRSNNANLCFHWFVTGDITRGQGEAHSIRQMIEAVASAHRIDRNRIFVTGLSAGGAMACAMLASYPDVFAGGAIIAGLPFASAGTVPEAFDRMRGHGGPDAATLQAKLGAASNHAGPWPTLSIWQGTADATVAPSNAEAIVTQWQQVHQIRPEPSREETVDGHRRRVWCDADGREVVESFSITGMGHGTPLDPNDADGVGRTGPFMLGAGISSTNHIARFWGIARPANAPRMSTQTAAGRSSHPLEGEIIAPGATAGRPSEAKAAPTEMPLQNTKVAKVIEDALRAAGLMR